MRRLIWNVNRFHGLIQLFPETMSHCSWTLIQIWIHVFNPFANSEKNLLGIHLLLKISLRIHKFGISPYL